MQLDMTRQALQIVPHLLNNHSEPQRLVFSSIRLHNLSIGALGRVPSLTILSKLLVFMRSCISTWENHLIVTCLQVICIFPGKIHLLWQKLLLWLATFIWTNTFKILNYTFCRSSVQTGTWSCLLPFHKTHLSFSFCCVALHSVPANTQLVQTMCCVLGAAPWDPSGSNTQAAHRKGAGYYEATTCLLQP